MKKAILRSKSTRRVNKNSEDEQIIETSLKRFRLTAEAESDIRKQGLEDLRFSIGTGQWDEAVKANREIEGKPCLVVNRAPTFLRQYTGEERQQRPAMIVSPVGSNTDPETADIIQGCLRHFEVQSYADVVYDDSYDMMLRIGWHNWRINQEYVNERSFQQEPRLAGVENPFAVYTSPVRKWDGTDPLWCHIVQDMSKEEYQAEFGRNPNKSAQIALPSDAGNAEPMWVVKDGARIAEYWWVELMEKELLQLDTGGTMFADEFEKAGFDKGLIVDRRDSIDRKVNWIKHNATHILERQEYVGRYIPIVEVNGVRLNVNGKRYKAGIIRDYRDAQRIYDFMVTRAVEQVDMTGKDPLFVAEGSIAGHEDEYRQLNRKNMPYMYFKAYDENGHQLPPPTRANREPPIQAMQALIHQADYDMKAVIGIYGNGPGESPGGNESAFSVLTRENKTDLSTVNWSDNLNRAIRYSGKIMLDLFPKLIDQPRIQRIINPDDTTKFAVLANSQGDAGQLAAAQRLIDGKAYKKIFDLGVGEYDVVLSAGPQFQTARKEAFRVLGALIESNPQVLFPILGDIWLSYGDFPGAHILVDRVKKMLPPQLQDQDASDPKQQVVALQGAMAQLQQVNQQLTGELGRAVDAIRTKRLELESKERIAGWQSQAGMIEAFIKANGAGAVEALKSELGAINSRMQLLNESLTIQQDAGEAPTTPELPNKVEPHVLPVTPAAPTAPVPGTSGGPQQ
jgi:hypothetical protein